MLTRTRFPLAVALLAALWSGEARAAIQLTPVINGLSAPVLVTSARDGSGRLFVVEQAGRILIHSEGALRPEAFLDIRDLVRSGGETGLLGLAVHPAYAGNGRFFVNYTRDVAGLETVIAEFHVSGDPNLAAAESQRILLTIPQPFDNHNGGMIEFGPDGLLYIGTGDGGAGGDPQGHGQNINSLLGKILRIDVDSGVPYAIPPGNPFVNAPGRDEIFAYGLRNPWRFSFDPATGRLFAGDVGQVSREEVDIIVNGGNYGWNTMEGNMCFSPPTNCNTAGLIPPIWDYARSEGTSITGGYVYRGSSATALVGKYVYGDFGSGTIWALTEVAGQWRNEELLRTGLNVSSFGEDESGELYVVDYGGSVLHIASDGAEPLLSAAGAVNAASFLGRPVAPGQLVSIFGAGLGPVDPAHAELDELGRLRDTLAETRVWFDDVSAPLLYVQQHQINVQVPYSAAGKATVVLQVQVGGVLSNPVELPVAETSPGLFARSQTGAGQAAILNQDLSANSAANPAARSSVVMLFATGAGQTTPPGEDGKLGEFPFPAPLAEVSATIGGVAAEIEFAGSAPGFAGLLQVNVRVPPQVPPAGAVPVVLHIGGRSSQPGMTVAVM